MDAITGALFYLVVVSVGGAEPSLSGVIGPSPNTFEQCVEQSKVNQLKTDNAIINGKQSGKPLKLGEDEVDIGMIRFACYVSPTGERPVLGGSVPEGTIFSDR